MEKLSIVIMTQDNERTIEKCLDSLKGLTDDIVVLDGGSKDKTIQICKKYSSRVYIRPFRYGKVGLTHRKNMLVKLAKNDWILSIDSDEVMSDELKIDIKKTLNNPTCSGYYLYRRDYAFLDRYITTTKILRLFDRTKGNFRDLIHEKAYVNGSVGVLKGALHHYSYRDVADYFARVNKYTEVEAYNLHLKNKSDFIVLLEALARPIAEFFIWYLGKGLWRRGMVGFFYSVGSGIYQFIKYMKYYELKNRA